MTGISIAGFMRQVVLLHQCGRTADEQRATNCVAFRIILAADLPERFFKNISDDNSLTDVNVPQRIEVDAAGVAQIFMRAGIKSLPGEIRCA